MGEAVQLKQRGNSWKISKSLEMSIRASEVITNTAMQFQRQVKKKTKRFRVKHWNLSLRNGPSPQISALQALGHKLKLTNEKWKQDDVTTSLSCLLFSTGLCYCDHKVLTPNSLPSLCKHTWIYTCAHTIRERWSTFGNVSSKCQLKITRVLEKVASEGTDIFLFWHDSVYLTRLRADMMGSTLSVS